MSTTSGIGKARPLPGPEPMSDPMGITHRAETVAHNELVAALDIEWAELRLCAREIGVDLRDNPFMAHGPETRQ